MYGKLFASTFTGSMYGSGPDVFAVWGYVIANTIDSQVELNPRLLAAVIGTDAGRIEAAITQLCAPDPRSRTKDHDGRRLIREGEFAYFVPNFMSYRAIRSEDDRRAYNRKKQQEHRARVKTHVIDSQSLSTLSAQAEAEAEAEAEADTEGRTKAKKRKAKDPAKESNFASNGDAAAKRTWLTPISELWHRRFGPGTFPFKQHGKALKTLYDAGEPMAEVARRLENYLAVTDAQFLSIPKFVQTYGDWSHAAKPRNGKPDRIADGHAAMQRFAERDTAAIPSSGVSNGQ